MHDNFFEFGCHKNCKRKTFHEQSYSKNMNGGSVDDLWRTGKKLLKTDNCLFTRFILQLRWAELGSSEKHQLQNR